MLFETENQTFWRIYISIPVDHPLKNSQMLTKMLQIDHKLTFDDFYFLNDHDISNI